MFRDLINKLKLESRILDKLTPAETETMSNNMAKKIVDMKLTVPAEIFLEMMRPVTVVSGISLWMGAPFLEIIGIKGYNYSKFFMKRENVQNLITKIKEPSE